MTGKDIVRHRDMYQKLFLTMIDYLNMGLGPEDAVKRNPLKEYEAEFGDAVRVHVRRPAEHDDRLRAGLRTLTDHARPTNPPTPRPTPCP